MKALILVGGYGTRLRPLTLTLPKPMVPFANKPMVVHQMEALAKVGVKNIVLAVNYQADVMTKFLKEYEEKLNITVTISHETEPLGTAGPLALARDILGSGDDLFFVLNSDIICDFPFEDMLRFHKNHGKEGTLVVTKVIDPTKYGVIVHDPDGKIIQFMEKPSVFVSNDINAGLYLFNPTVLDRIELKPTSIEKEVFPRMAHDRQLYCMSLDGFWMDVGQPKDYLVGLGLYFMSLRSKEPNLLARGEHIRGDVLMDDSVKIGRGCLLGPNVSIGKNVVIEEGARVQHSAILDGAVIKANAWVNNTIVGWNSQVGRWCRVTNVTVLGEDVEISDEVYCNGGKVLPYKSVSTDVSEPQIIM